MVRGRTQGDHPGLRGEYKLAAVLERLGRPTRRGCGMSRVCVPGQEGLYPVRWPTAQVNADTRSSSCHAR